MTREKEIRKEAIEVTRFAQFGHSGRDMAVAYDAFILGAQWADAHQKEGMVNKQEFIEKAKEWLQRTLYIHTEIEEDKDWSETNPTDWVTSDYDTVEDFINGFIKAIEK